MKLCPKCQIRYLNPPFKGYKRNMCWVCYLKTIKMYSAAKKEVGGWFDWGTHLSKDVQGIPIKLGWSFTESMGMSLLFAAVLNAGSMNKTPKVPELEHGTKEEKLIKLGYSLWKIETFMKYYRKLKP